jgi:hypothetical protein
MVSFRRVNSVFHSRHILRVLHAPQEYSAKPLFYAYVLRNLKQQSLPFICNAPASLSITSSAMPLPSRSQPLSSQLSNLPKQDKSAFVDTFVRDQRSYSKVYAQQGRERIQACGTGKSMIGELRPRPPDEGVGPGGAGFGFDTPLLKPRGMGREIAGIAPKRNDPVAKKQNKTASQNTARNVNSDDDDDSDAENSQPTRREQLCSTREKENEGGNRSRKCETLQLYPHEYRV